MPVGILGQAGVTWAAQPNNSQGQPLVTQNGAPEAYGFTAELGTKITDWAAIFAKYGISNTFPGWKGGSGPIDIRAVHFFHPGDHGYLWRSIAITIQLCKTFGIPFPVGVILFMVRRERLVRRQVR